MRHCLRIVITPLIKLAMYWPAAAFVTLRLTFLISRSVLVARHAKLDRDEDHEVWQSIRFYQLEWYSTISL